MVVRRSSTLTVTLTALLAATALCSAAVPADAAPAEPTGTLRVQLREAPTRIAPDGDVRAVLRIRCSPDLYLFEVDVSVRQGAAVGQVTLLRGRDPLPVCDGDPHRFVVEVPPADAPFRAGAADVGAFVGAYGDGTGDLGQQDQVRVRLRRG